MINNSIYHYRKQQKNHAVDLDGVLYKVEDNDEVAPVDHGQTELKASKSDGDHEKPEGQLQSFFDLTFGRRV